MSRNVVIENFSAGVLEQWGAGWAELSAWNERGIYVSMQGPSELGASGKLVSWDRSQDLGRITVPTLTVGARHDTMDPAHMEWMATQIPKGRYLYCPDGSHLAMYDDQQIYMRGIIQFLHDVDAGR